MKRVITILIALIFTMGVSAQNPAIQSAFIYNFTKFIEWPYSKKSGNFIIGVVGNTSIISYLKKMADSKKVGSQSIVIKNFSDASDAYGCHMIFLPKSKSSQIGDAIIVAKSNNTLLLTEKSGLGVRGSGINFIIEGGNMKFEINKSAIKKSGLVVSSKLLSLGKEL